MVVVYEIAAAYHVEGARDAEAALAAVERGEIDRGAAPCRLLAIGLPVATR